MAENCCCTVDSSEQLSCVRKRQRYTSSSVRTDGREADEGQAMELVLVLGPGGAFCTCPFIPNDTKSLLAAPMFESKIKLTKILILFYCRL